MKYELDDYDLEMFKKVKKAMIWVDDGCPLKDFLDNDDIKDSLRLLVAIVDAEGEND